MSVTRKAVHSVSLHTSPTKEMSKMRNRKQIEVIVRCVGERKEPSAEALDRFCEIYARMVKENRSKKREVNDHEKAAKRV